MMALSGTYVLLLILAWIEWPLAFVAMGFTWVMAGVAVVLAVLKLMGRW